MGLFDTWLTRVLTKEEEEKEKKLPSGKGKKAGPKKVKEDVSEKLLAQEVALKIAELERKEGALEEREKLLKDKEEELNKTKSEIEEIKKKEIERLRKVCQTGKMVTVNPTKVDLMFESKDGAFYLFDIKTAKPNSGGFKEFKRTLLEWVAVILACKPKADVHSLIAIPYNPYEPEPYSRWTMRGMLDLENELKVADEFWDFLGGKGTYKDLLDCFERVGIELRDEIDTYFKRFNK